MWAHRNTDGLTLHQWFSPVTVVCGSWHYDEEGGESVHDTTSDETRSASGDAEIIELSAHTGSRWGSWGAASGSSSASETQTPTEQAPTEQARESALERLRAQIATVEADSGAATEPEAEPETGAEVIGFPNASHPAASGREPNDTTALCEQSQDADESIAAAKDQLTRMLARSDKSRHECLEYLRRETELTSADAMTLVDEYTECGYINDARLAEQLVSGALSRKGLGRTGMERELRKRGLDDVVIEEALGEFDRDAEYDNALEIARARAQRLHSVEYEAAKRRLYGYLARRGFSGEVVGRAVAETLDSRARGGSGSHPRSSGPYFR